MVALNSADFELDLDGQLNEYQDRKALGRPVLALSMQGCQIVGRVALFGEFLSHLFLPFILAFVGCGLQRSNRPNHLTRPREHPQYNQFTSGAAPPSSICIADMLDASINKAQPTMFVNIGLQNELLKTVLDPINGQLTGTRTRYVVLLFFLLSDCQNSQFLL